MALSLLLAGWLTAVCIAVFARRAAARRKELIARACHELRGPITASRLGLELGARLGELTSDRLRALEVELGRAALALEDLGSVGRRQGAVRLLELVSVDDLLAQCVGAWAASARAHRVELRIGSSTAARLRCDRLRIAQATGNLVANAIEHGGGAIELRARSGVGSVCLEVIDGGPGLPAPVATHPPSPRGPWSARPRIGDRRGDRQRARRTPLGGAERARRAARARAPYPLASVSRGVVRAALAPQPIGHREAATALASWARNPPDNHVESASSRPSARAASHRAAERGRRAGPRFWRQGRLYACRLAPGVGPGASIAAI